MVFRSLMNAIFRQLFSVAVILGIVTAASADPPVSSTGKVLVIDYDRLMEGTIERDGNRFRIRQGAGEMTVPATPNMILVPDREAAYQLVKSRIKPGDLMDRVRLTRWCLANHFNAHAVEQAEAALAIQPNDQALMTFCDDVKLRASLAPPPMVKVAPQPVRLAPPEPAIVEVNPESFSAFVTKVQPILMNACAQCHTEDRGGAFHLARTSMTYGDTRATQFNLAAVSSFVNHDQPAISPLLTRAICIHGECLRPPLKDRQNMAYRHLEEWVQLATGKKIAPPPTAAAMPGAAVAESKPLPPEPNKEIPPAAADNTPSNDTPATIVLPPLRGKAVSSPLPASANDPLANHPINPLPASPGQAPTGATPGRLPAMPANTEPVAPDQTKVEPVDPFDPAQFNRMNPPKNP